MARHRAQWNGVIEDLPPSILDTRVCELPCPVIDKLGLMLYNDGRGDSGNWEGLAEELGITTVSELEAIRRRAQVEKTFPGCCLLKDWMAGEGKTVYVLLRALKAQRRLDCLEFLVQKCQGLHSMELHVKIEFEPGHYEFQSISTEMDASLASSLENILNYLPNYVIMGPDLSISWNTPARLLKGRQLSLKKVEATDDTKRFVYGRPSYPITLPSQTRQPNQQNHLDQSQNGQLQTAGLKEDIQMICDMTYNIPVTSQTLTSNMQFSDAINSTSFNNLSRCILTSCTTTPINSGTSLTVPKHQQFCDSLTTLKRVPISSSQSTPNHVPVSTHLTAAELETASRELNSMVFPDPEWPSLQTNSSFFYHSMQQTEVKEIRQATESESPSCTQTVTRPQYKVIAKDNKICIKEHFMKNNPLPGPMTVRQFLTANTTYSNPGQASRAGLPPQPDNRDPSLVYMKNSSTSSNSPGVSTSGLKNVAVNTSQTTTSMPQSVMSPVMSTTGISVQSPPSVLFNSASSGCTATSTPKPCVSSEPRSYIDLNHPIFTSVPPVPCVLASGEQLPVSVSTSLTDNNNPTPFSTNTGTVNSQNANPKPCTFKNRPDGYVEMLDDDFNPVDMVGTGGAKQNSNPAQACVIHQDSDGYFGFADTNNENIIATASNDQASPCQNLNSLLNENKMSKSDPLIITRSSDGYFGFANSSDSPMETEPCLFPMELSQSDSNLMIRDQKPTEQITAATSQNTSKKVSWQLTYSCMANEDEEEFEDYIDMSGHTLSETTPATLTGISSARSLDSQTVLLSEYTYIPCDDVTLTKPRSMSLQQEKPPLPMKRIRSESTPVFTSVPNIPDSDIPGWCPDVTEMTIKPTMDKFKKEDGNFIVWRRRKNNQFVISVSHLGEIRHYVIHQKEYNRQVYFYIFASGKETTDLKDLITHYQKEGLKGPDPHLTGSRGKKWQKFSHIQLKIPLKVKHVTTAVRKENTSN